MKIAWVAWSSTLGGVGGALLALTLGCTGTIGDAPQPSAGGQGNGAAGPTSVNDPPPGTSIVEESCAAVIDPGPSPLRGLTRTEYAHTIRDLTEFDPEASNLLAVEDRRVTTFDRSSQNFSLEKRHVRAYLDVAEAASESMLGSPASRAKFLGCEPTGSGSAACLTNFATLFGRKAFRRTLAPDEVAALVTLAQTAKDDPDTYAGAKLIVQGILQSPKFLMHVELGVPEAPGVRRRLTGAERASRLSYLTLGTAPDDALLTAAEKGGLDDPNKVEQTAAAMLADERARTSLRSFFEQWLGIASLKDTAKDPIDYPIWNDGLKQSMLEETTRIIEDFAWTKGRSFIDVLTSRHTFVDANLAKLYGMPPPTSGFQSVSLEGVPRFGLLTQASWLAVMSGGDVTPIRRGKFIRANLLCAPPISLPPNGVPDLPPPAVGESARQRLERHRADPKCAACHKFLDPLGFGLARYDDVGAYRETDAHGQQIDDSGNLAYDGNPNVRVSPVPEFQGPGELVHRLRDSGAFQACVVEKLFEFALARPEEDRCVSQPVKQAFTAGGYDFSSAVAALVRTDAFLYRRDPAQEGAP